MVTNPRTVCLNYIKSFGFLLDVAAVLPLELFALAWSPSGEQWNYIALFRINRLLKLWKVCMHNVRLAHNMVVVVFNSAGDIILW